MPTATVDLPEKAIIDLNHECRQVPDFVVEAIARVRRSGWRDMYDRETVMMLAATIGHREAAEWLVEHRHLYFIGLRRAEAVLAA
jgi:hypothetical protein